MLCGRCCDARDDDRRGEEAHHYFTTICPFAGSSWPGTLPGAAELIRVAVKAYDPGSSEQTLANCPGGTVAMSLSSCHENSAHAAEGACFWSLWMSPQRILSLSCAGSVKVTRTGCEEKFAKASISPWSMLVCEGRTSLPSRAIVRVSCLACSPGCSSAASNALVSTESSRERTRTIVFIRMSKPPFEAVVRRSEDLLSAVP